MHHKIQHRNLLKYLRAFCYAAKLGSISKAADRMMLSQPSVSLQIKALEQHLGGLLFERRGPRIRLTPAGHFLLDLARPLVEGFDRLPASFAAWQGDIDSGTLRIAAGESTILYLLPEFIKRFSDRYRNIDLHLLNVPGQVGLELLRNDEVDFAVGSLLDTPEDMYCHPIFHFEPVLIVPLTHPLAERERISLEEISPYGLILPPRHLSTWGMVERLFQQHNIPYKVKLEVGGWEVIKRYVELGMGIGIVTNICLRKDDALAHISLRHYFPQRHYGAILRRGKCLSPQAHRFLEMMDRNFFRRMEDQVNKQALGKRL